MAAAVAAQVRGSGWLAVGTGRGTPSENGARVNGSTEDVLGFDGANVADARHSRSPSTYYSIKHNSQLPPNLPLSL